MKYFHYDEDGYLESFDVERFIKDYDYNTKVYQSLLDQMAELTELHGTNSDAPKVQTNRRNDGVESLVLRIFNLQNKITAYQHYFLTYKTAMAAISDSDRDLLRILFGNIRANPIAAAMREFNVSHSELYRRRTAALKRFSDFVIGDTEMKKGTN